MDVDVDVDVIVFVHAFVHVYPQRFFIGSRSPTG